MKDLEGQLHGYKRIATRFLRVRVRVCARACAHPRACTIHDSLV